MTPPITDAVVAIKARSIQLYDLDIAIGIKSTSAGIGKNIDSMKLKKPRTFLDFNNRSFCIK